ncbi:MAG: RNA polymerase sigma-70 factor [Lewinellaceae bacterium]|nr:RNA polymerase sigma-70 factor [Lewinellaceae bacterium]
MDRTDAELLAWLRRNPDEAIDAIFRQYFGELCRAIYRIIPDEAIVQDLAQEVFVQLWQRRQSLSVQTTLGAYLRRAGINRALNYLRDNRRFSDADDTQVLEAQLSHETNIEHSLEVEELQEAIDRAIDQLPERCRLVFVLSRFEELSHQEIADQLAISPKTVENQITKALRLLRSVLGPLLEREFLMLLALFWAISSG